jgi:hypothetical protein
MLPVLWNFFQGERDGVVVSDHSMTLLANLLRIELIPVYRNLANINTQTKGEDYKQKILSVMGKLTNSKPDYQHQGKAVINQVVDALHDKNVFLAPSGVTNRVARWKPGISHIISEADKTLQDFALSFVYIPDSFKEKFSFVLFESWMQVLDSEAVEWTDNPRQNAESLQAFYESLRTTK